MHDTHDFWFPAKRFGWGWGLPVRWQGWVVFALYLALVVGGIRFFKDHNDRIGAWLYLAVLTVAFVAIVIAKGERPAGWRWGRK